MMATAKIERDGEEIEIEVEVEYVPADDEGPAGYQVSPLGDYVLTFDEVTEIIEANP